jgi:hypothetical protein
MLHERYKPMNLFDLVQALSLALAPVLTPLDHLLDDDTLSLSIISPTAPCGTRACGYAAGCWAKPGRCLRRRVPWLAGSHLYILSGMGEA